MQHAGKQDGVVVDLGCVYGRDKGESWSEQ